jgi:uncharacterized protein YcfJ
MMVTGAVAGGAVRRFVGSGAGTSLETVAMAIVAGPRPYANISLTHSLTSSLTCTKGRKFELTRAELCDFPKTKLSTAFCEIRNSVIMYNRADRSVKLSRTIFKLESAVSCRNSSSRSSRTTTTTTTTVADR